MSCIFRPAWRCRDGFALLISWPLDSTDGKSTGDPQVGSLALALAPSPLGALQTVEKIEPISRVAPPAPRGRAGDVKPVLQSSHPRKQNVQSISYIYAMKNSLLNDTSISTPQVHVTRKSHPSMCTHHTAAAYAGWLPVCDDAP